MSPFASLHRGSIAFLPCCALACNADGLVSPDFAERRGASDASAPSDPLPSATSPDAAVESLAQRFFNVQARVGLGGYVASSGERGEVHAPGGVFTDLDQDGFADLVLVTRAGQPSYLFHNVPEASDPSGKSRRFEPRAIGAELPGSTGAIAADVDNDGDLDVYITNNGENILYRNLLAETTELRFENVTRATDPTPDVDDDQLGVGLARHDGVTLEHSLTAAFGDYDRDGWVDLYVGNHLLMPDDPAAAATFRPGERDTLYHNNGDGTFTDVTLTHGVTGWQNAEGSYEDEYQVFSSTNAVTWADFNDDLWPDLFVSNKCGTPSDVDLLYLNRGVGADGEFLGFDPVTHRLTPPFGYLAELAMGVMAKDHDNDGDLDVYLTDIASNPMWENTFADTGVVDFQYVQGFDCTWSWGAQWQDFSNDGWLDLHASTSAEFRDCLWLHTADGVHASGLGLGLDQRRSSRGTMSADYDLDGWLDLVVLNLDGPPSLFQNVGPSDQARWLTLSLVGRPRQGGAPSSTRDALGARVVVAVDLEGDGTLSRLRRDVTSGDSNSASTSSLALHFGVGKATSVDVEIHWPSGEQSWLSAVDTNQFMVVEEPEP